jgi:hypothetical protein
MENFDKGNCKTKMNHNPLSNSEEDGHASAINRIGSCQFVIVVSAAGERTMLPSEQQEKGRGKGEAMTVLAQIQTG